VVLVGNQIDALMFVKGSDGVLVAAVLGLSGGVLTGGYCWVTDKTGMGVRDGTQALIRSVRHEVARGEWLR
jgi:hypothetical protein